MLNSKRIDVKNEDSIVYDISLDGTVVNALGMNVISNTDGFNFQMPKEEDLSEFNKFYSVIKVQIDKNNKENKKLITLRDTLLPKLMSGEIDVSDLDI